MPHYSYATGQGVDHFSGLLMARKFGYPEYPIFQSLHTR